MLSCLLLKIWIFFSFNYLKNTSLELIDAVTSNVVFDLSHRNKNDDFKLAKSNGTVAVIHKATQGIRHIDFCYKTRRITAKKNGLLWGAYHFGTNASGVAQAHHFLNNVGKVSKTLFVLYLESNINNIMTQKQAKDFIITVQNKTGKLVMVHGSYNTLKKFSTSFLKENPLWISSYNTALEIPSGWNKWVLWKYTNGKLGLWPHGVTGIGPCNRSIFNGSVRQLNKFWLHDT